MRIHPVLHEKLSRQATQKGVSLNNLCIQYLQQGLKKQPELIPALFHELAGNLKIQFGRDLLGLLLFGSRISGTATPLSDRDFLVVLSPRIPLSRSLYRWWDQNIQSPQEEQWNPQFVHLPVTIRDAGSLWFETAVNHKVVWEKNSDTSRFIRLLLETIARDEVRRYWSNGHPYWVWRSHEEPVISH